MINRLMLSGLLAMSLILSLNFSAIAGGIAGWGWSCCSSMEGDVDLKGVPNPEKKPSVATATGDLTVEVLCVNRGGNANEAFRTGNAFLHSSALDPIDLGQVFGKGQGTAHFSFPLGDAFSQVTCQNDNWTLVDDSALVTLGIIRMDWFLCNGDDADGDACTEDVGEGVIVLTVGRQIATQTIECTPPEGVDLRTDEGITLNNEYDCVETDLVVL